MGLETLPRSGNRPRQPDSQGLSEEVTGKAGTLSDRLWQREGHSVLTLAFDSTLWTSEGMGVEQIDVQQKERVRMVVCEEGDSLVGVGRPEDPDGADCWPLRRTPQGYLGLWRATELLAVVTTESGSLSEFYYHSNEDVERYFI